MDKLSIKLNIANRFYPMKIERSSEENIRNAVKKIDDRLKFYEDNYEIKDKQDLLAMCLIEYASKLEKINKNKFINFFNSISIFKFSYNFISMGIFCVIFSIIYRRLFTKYREVYIEFLGLFALFQFIWTLYCCFLFYEFRTAYFLYGAVIAFSFFYLLMYERRIFNK